MLHSRTQIEGPQPAPTDVQIKTLLARSYLARCVQALTDLIHLLLSTAGHCHRSQQCLDHVSCSYPGILKQTFCWGKEHNCRICTERRNFILAGREIKYPNRLFPSLISIIHGHLMIPFCMQDKSKPEFPDRTALCH